MECRYLTRKKNCNVVDLLTVEELASKLNSLIEKYPYIKDYEINIAVECGLSNASLAKYLDGTFLYVNRQHKTAKLLTNDDRGHTALIKKGYHLYE